MDRMNPYPQKNSVLVLDNASVHHFEDLRALVEGRGMCLRYLPPYSPDLNPIHEGFSGMKAWTCKNNEYILGELTGDDTCDPYTILRQAVFDSVTQENSENIVEWYKDSGYVV